MSVSSLNVSPDQRVRPGHVDHHVVSEPLLAAGAFLAFILSGAACLMYEVVWYKLFSYVWGSSTIAVGAVVTGFFCGLACGSYFIGKVSRHYRKPLILYGLCELGIGALALIIPAEVSVLRDIWAHLSTIGQDSTLVTSLLRYGLTLLVLAPPCVLIGGTLPLMVEMLTARELKLSFTVSGLYASNTFGAALGCYVAGFHLIPSFGLIVTNMLGAGLSVALGVSVLVLAWYLRRHGHHLQTERNQDNVTSALDKSLPSSKAIQAALLMTGCAALILQMVWARQLAVMLGGSVYAISSTVIVLLVGLAVGSGIVSHLSPIQNGAKRLMIVIAVLASSVVLGRALVPYLSAWVGLLRDDRATQLGNAAVCLGMASVLEFPAAVCMGMLTPLMLTLSAPASQVGSHVGRLYAVSTIGNVIGACVAPILLIPTLGLSYSAAIAISAYFLSVLVLIPQVELRPSPASVAYAIFGLLMVHCVRLPQDPRLANSGMYLYGPASRDALETRSVEYYAEGSSCNVMVTKHGAHTALSINGKVDASSGSDMSTQLGLAYFPRFMHPSPQRVKNVAVIGFGSGTTCGASLLFPDTRVTACEIESSVLEAARHFAHLNHQPQKSKFFRAVIDDGRSFIQSSSTEFDIIISEPSNPWIAGIGGLFTREFYKEVRAHMRPDGVFAQWIQAYDFTFRDYAMVLRTMRSIFAKCWVVRINGGDTIVIAANEVADVASDLSSAQELINRTNAVSGDLVRWFGTADVKALMLAHVLLDTSGVDRCVLKDGAKSINTDQNLRLESDAPLRLFKRGKSEEEVVLKQLMVGASANWFKEIFYRWQCSKAQSDGLSKLALVLMKAGSNQVALEVLQLGLLHDPGNGTLLRKFLSLRAAQGSDEWQKTLTVFTQADPKSAFQLGVDLWNERQFSLAATVFRRLVDQEPLSASLWANLAVNLQECGDLHEANRAYERALDIDPYSMPVKEKYEDFRRQKASNERGK